MVCRSFVKEYALHRALLAFCLLVATFTLATASAYGAAARTYRKLLRHQHVALDIVAERNPHSPAAPLNPANAPAFAAFPPSPKELSDLHGFIMSMCVDKDGRTWIGTEEDGVYCFDPALPLGLRWTHYTTAEGLADNSVYALCCDRFGRVWAGSDRTGVSVLSGHAWRNYDELTGPLGGHVYALAASPMTGDVWLATECGLSRYSLTKNAWDNFIAPSGIALTQVSSLAFNRSGDIIVGMQTAGVAIGSAADGFRTWTAVAASPLLPYRDNQRNAAALPPLATARVRTFWSGVYESFVVCGPSKYYLAVLKNNSLNTIVSSVLFDKIAGPPTPCEDQFLHIPSVFLISPQYASYTAPPTKAADTSPIALLTDKIWNELGPLSGNAAEAGSVTADRMLCYRALAAEPQSPSSIRQLAYLRRSLPCETPADKLAFTSTMSSLFSDEERLCPTLEKGTL